MAAELGISERSVQRLLNSMTDVHFTGGGGRGHWVIDDVYSMTDAQLIRKLERIQGA